MGELADEVLEGEMCQYCGQVFIDSCGHPRTCQACIEDGIDVPPEEDIDLDKP